jgi:adenosylmethionine-8-amino-7-oxononanoate aminotransferase
MSRPVFVGSDDTSVFPRELDRHYPLIERASGVWLFDPAGTAYLDAVGGGAMVTCLGHGVPEIIAAAREQADRVAFLYNQQFTTPSQEALAAELVEVAPKGFTRVHFVSGGSEANEMAVRLARSYHVERGESSRHQIISPAQAYHGPTMVALGLTGRPALQRPFDPYVVPQFHIPPSTWRFDPNGRMALSALDEALEMAGPHNVSAFFCEPVSAAALPAYTPPEAFWRGLAERRERHGFLVCFDEVVTGIGRTGSWFAADGLPIEPDIITVAKGLGAGYASVGGVLCREHVYDAVASGSRSFELGHTWDGAPLPCAVGRAVLRYLKEHQLVERVAQLGEEVRAELAAALEGCAMVREVRGRGFLFGIDYVDPRDRNSLLPAHLNVARRIDMEALRRGLIVYSTQPTLDGYAGDQTLLAPAFVSTREELTTMVERMAAAIKAVQSEVEASLGAAAGAG